MKQKAMRAVSAFTRIELIVVIVIVLIGVVLASMLLPERPLAIAKAGRISCLNNLKEIGTAYRLWSGDGGDKPPAETKIENGGWADFLTNADQAAICWTNYAIMAKELDLNPKLIVCPGDERRPARDFTTDFNDNTHLSYFVGVSADDVQPQSIQGGDRNLGNGPEAYRGYGYSPRSGQGNDVAIQTNSLFKPVSWSVKMHSASYGPGAGNILLGDGSSQQTSSAAFRSTWLSHADPTTTWPAGHIPSSPSIRLIFP